MKLLKNTKSLSRGAVICAAGALAATATLAPTASASPLDFLGELISSGSASLAPPTGTISENFFISNNVQSEVTIRPGTHPCIDRIDSPRYPVPSYFSAQITVTLKPTAECSSADFKIGLEWQDRRFATVDVHVAGQRSSLQCAGESGVRCDRSGQLTSVTFS